MTTFFRLLTLSLLLATGVPTLAEDEAPLKPVEIGVTAGYPVGAGFLIGYWGRKPFPLVARFSTGVGTSLDLGWGFEAEHLNAYIGVSMGAIGYLGVLLDTQYVLGPIVGLRWKSLTVSLGPTVLFEGSKAAVLRAHGQLSWTGMF